MTLLKHVLQVGIHMETQTNRSKQPEAVLVVLLYDKNLYVYALRNGCLPGEHPTVSGFQLRHKTLPKTSKTNALTALLPGRVFSSTNAGVLKVHMQRQPKTPNSSRASAEFFGPSKAWSFIMEPPFNKIFKIHKTNRTCIWF